MKIALGSDHAAFELKEILKPYLVELGYEYDDMGAFTDGTPANDYHLTGAEVAAAVVDGSADLGIVMCGTGIGMSIAANKVPGAAAALCYSIFGAQKAREHNNANVLVLGARMTGVELAKEIVRVWLVTKYEGGRHEPRNANLKEIEQRYKHEGKS